jgi:hypothetical protein
MGYSHPLVSQENGMLPRNEMRDFIHRIVADAMPEEVLAFEVEGESIISDLYDEVPVAESSCNSEYEFLDSAAAQIVLEFVKLLTATLVLVKAFSDLAQKKDASDDELERQWAAQMIRAGLSEKKAKEIAGRFAKDLAKRLRRT